MLMPLHLRMLAPYALSSSSATYRVALAPPWSPSFPHLLPHPPPPGPFSSPPPPLQFPFHLPQVPRTADDPSEEDEEDDYENGGGGGLVDEALQTQLEDPNRQMWFRFHSKQRALTLLVDKIIEEEENPKILIFSAFPSKCCYRG